MIADLDWGREILCGDHSASGDRCGENDLHAHDASFLRSIDQYRKNDQEHISDEDREGDPLFSTERDREVDPHLWTCQDREVNPPSHDESFELSVGQDR